MTYSLWLAFKPDWVEVLNMGSISDPTHRSVISVDNLGQSKANEIKDKWLSDVARNMHDYLLKAYTAVIYWQQCKKNNNVTMEQTSKRD